MAIVQAKKPRDSYRFVRGARPDAHRVGFVPPQGRSPRFRQERRRAGTGCHLPQSLGPERQIRNVEHHGEKIDKCRNPEQQRVGHGLTSFKRLDYLLRFSWQRRRDSYLPSRRLSIHVLPFLSVLNVPTAFLCDMKKGDHDPRKQQREPTTPPISPGSLLTWSPVYFFSFRSFTRR